MPEGALAPTIFSALVLVLGIVLVLGGWRNMKRRHSDVPEPFEAFEDTITHRFEGMYVATTRFEDWLQRIAAHDLGVRTKASLELGERGLHFMRHGAADVHIPWQAFDRATRTNGMIGKFVEKNGLIVASWDKDGFSFDTGFRPRYSADTPKIYQLLASHQDDAAEQETN